LKVDEMSLIHRLWKLIDKIWREELFCSQWEKGLICPNYKERNQMMCENYHGISLLNTVHKYSQLYYFKDYNPLWRQVLKMIRVGLGLKSLFQTIYIQSDNYCKRVKTYYIFVHFKAAYDSIDRAGLFKAMEEF
jgi:hypothetical protein